MSSPFNIKKTTSVGRNGFDLSQRHLFGAVPGMLLPIMHEECIPGDTFRINLDSFTRMRPLNTAAFARFKEYFDFYYCSKDTLWPYYNQMVVNNNEPVAMPNMNYTTAPSHVPRIKNIDITQFIADNRETPVNDDMGVNLGDGTAILMDLLGCGDFKFTYQQTTDGLWLSMLPWAMYQQIYANYYRNPQWERRDVVSYNLRQFYSGGDYTSAQFALIAPHLLKMRYANWHKDYFMGLYPTQQFGDVSVVDSSNFGLKSSVIPTGTYPLAGVSNVNGSVGLRSTDSSNLVSTKFSMSDGGLSIVDLRRAQALQRWKEVTMTNGSSMYQQVKAHYGFELPEGRKDAPEFIGGMDNVVVINDVDATAAGSSPLQNSQVGQVYGKAAAASDIRKTIEFTAKDFGYIMCIYHVEPLLEYDAVGVKASNLHLEAADEFIPEFDKIGFGSLRMQELMFWDTSDTQGGIYPSTLLGYTSRYLDRKCSYDRVHGSFMQNGNVNDKAWTVALSWQYLYSLFESASSNPIDFRFFKVNPFIANNIMQVQIPTEHEGTPLLSQIQGYEPFMCSASFKIYKTSNMSVDSLPY